MTVPFFSLGTSDVRCSREFPYIFFADTGGTVSNCVGISGKRFFVFRRYHQSTAAKFRPKWASCIPLRYHRTTCLAGWSYINSWFVFGIQANTGMQSARRLASFLGVENKPSLVYALEWHPVKSQTGNVFFSFVLQFLFRIRRHSVNTVVH